METRWKASDCLPFVTVLTYFGGGYSQSNPYAQQDKYDSNDNYGGGAPGKNTSSPCAPESREGDEIDFANKLKVEPYSPLGAGNNYEMGSMNDAAPPSYPGDSQQEFFAEVNELRDGIDTVKANISRIESLHQRSLTDIDESTSSQTQHQLDALVAETSALNKNLANRIKRLKSKAASDPAKGPQVGNLDRNFKDTLRKYQTVEAAYSKRAKEQMARQYRIVKPDASDQEVEEACSDTQGAQIFSQAVRFCLKAYLEKR